MGVPAFYHGQVDGFFAAFILVVNEGNCAAVAVYVGDFGHQLAALHVLNQGFPAFWPHWLPVFGGVDSVQPDFELPG